MAAVRALGRARASSSLSRVRGVRRSWLTEARRAVRWSIWRWMRSFMAMKAWAALRTSRAPCGLNWGTSPPRPKASAASASRSMARTWLRMNRIDTQVSSTVARPIHRMKMLLLLATARSMGAITRRMPWGVSISISTRPA